MGDHNPLVGKVSLPSKISFGHEVSSQSAATAASAAAAAISGPVMVEIRAT